MAIPFLGAVAAVVATGGAVKTIDALDDMSTAKRINSEAQSLADSSTKRRENKRKDTEKRLENLGRKKIEIMSGSIRDFINTIEQIHNIPHTIF